VTAPEPTPVTGAPWGAIAPPGATTAAGSAARLGAYCWAEQQVFALLGIWVTEVPEHAAKLAFAEHADHAAWRAQRWYELLPTAPPGPDALLVAPPGLEGLGGAIAELVSGPERTVEKLAVAYRVLLPGLAAAVDAHRDWVSPVAEPSVDRVLAIVATDLATDWVAGERLLQSAMTTQEAIEAELIAAGGIVGAFSTGSPDAGGAS
jgi:hypothetical protein